ncbi:hypothetical protein C0J52_18543 [Blattella germanica]|nr:hypothetical protein C0J52_18543 [Blattella germanica]
MEEDTRKDIESKAVIAEEIIREEKNNERDCDTDKLPSKSQHAADQSSYSRDSAVDNSNLHYEGDVCIYTDPVSKHEYVWSSEKNEWLSRTGSDQDNKRSNESKVKADGGTLDEKPSNENENAPSGNDYEFDGEYYCYKDDKTGKTKFVKVYWYTLIFTGITYKYDNIQKKWVKKEPKEPEADKDSEESDEEAKDNVVKQDMSSGTYGYEGDTHTYTDATDGTVYFWDKEKNAWFPKVDEDFLAHYQMNYGFTDTNNGSSADVDKELEEKKENSQEEEAPKRKLPQEPSWFEMDDQHNTKVYVSNLPLDVTEQEFVDVMQKCGLVMKDVETGKMKIKLYTEPGSSQLKGDGLCSYIKVSGNQSLMVL